MRAHLAYFRYVLRHKWYVLRASRMVGASLWDAVTHDLSKLLPSEWFPYVHTFYDGQGRSRYRPGPDFEQAWNQHQKRNAHHWQHWLLVMDMGYELPLPMPERQIRHMVADWVGAGWAIRGRIDPWTWYHRNRHRMRLHPHTRGRVLEVLEELRVKLHQPVFTVANPDVNEEAREAAAAMDEDALFADGFDDAIIGVFHRCGQPAVVAYSYERCVEILMNDGLTREEAEEHMGFNVEGGWVGDRTPAFVHTIHGDDQ